MLLLSVYSKLKQAVQSQQHKFLTNYIKIERNVKAQFIKAMERGHESIQFF